MCQQLSDTVDYDIYTANDQKNFIELINKKKIDVFVLNIQDIDSSSKTLINILLDKNKFIGIVGYYDNIVKLRTASSI